MYGMVNQGIRAFIVGKFGEADWGEICVKAGLADDDFETMGIYPDEITYKLVGVIAEKYDLKSDEVLEVFGDYWVDYSSKSEIGQLWRFGGSELVERLENLDEMHERIQLTMPHLKPPSFDFVEMENGRFSLRYWSDREGLESMVIGLVQGLARQTGESVTICQDKDPVAPDARATFTIEFVD